MRDWLGCQEALPGTEGVFRQAEKEAKMKSLFRWATVIAVVIFVLWGAASWAARGEQSAVLALEGLSARSFLRQLAAGPDSPEGRNFLEAVPVVADPGDNGEFGASVAVEGDTALIGAPQADGSKGAAYIFRRIDGEWVRQQKLVPADRSQILQFGIAVDLHNDMAIIGATGGENDSNPGSAYIFSHSGTGWGESGRLVAYDARPGDGFGSAVALDEDRAIVGARYAGTGDLAGRGAAYVFSYFSGTWSLQGKLSATDGKPADDFGTAVALDGNTAVVGASMADIGSQTDQGAVYVYTYDRRWSQRKKLIAFDGRASDYFGSGLDLDGDTILVGAWNKDVAPNAGQGAAYVYQGSGEVWNLQQKLTVNDGDDEDHFGRSVALDGNSALIGATGWDYVSYLRTEEDVGAAYIFTRSGDLWTRQQELIAHDGEEDDLFGSAVDLDRDTAVIGAVRAIDVDSSGAGKFYVTERGPQPWQLVDSVQDSDTNGCPGFGYAVAMEGSTAVVGRSIEYGDDGAVYFYELEGGAWIEKQTFDMAGSAASIALQGNTAVVGSPYADAGPGAQNHGAAYVYVNEGGLWKQQQKLVAGDGQEYDHFGQSVALDGGTIMIGSDRHNGNGAVYVFTRSGGMWNKQQKLVAGDNQSWGYFGASLALEGDTVMIGAPGSYGAVYVFERSGASWTGSQKLVAGDPFDFSQFGGSIALDGDTALIGASYQEAAYIFGWDGSKWLEKQKIVAADNTDYSSLGKAVALDGDMAVIGAVRAAIGSNRADGAAYVYLRGESDWEQTQKLIPPPGPQPAVFGYPALDGSRVLIGAPGDDYYCSGVRHFAYFFEGEKLMQYITFPRPSGGEIGESILLKAEASSGLPVVYVSKTPAVCSSSDGLAVLLANGVCRITASQMGDNVYAPAQDAEVEFAIGASAYQLYLPAFPGDRTDE